MPWPPKTVKVETSDGGFAVINGSDFDPQRHTLFMEAAEAPKPKRRGRGRPKKEAAAK